MPGSILTYDDSKPDNHRYCISGRGPEHRCVTLRTSEQLDLEALAPPCASGRYPARRGTSAIPFGFPRRRHMRCERAAAKEVVRQ